jgi:hypothetical protein
MYKFNTEDLAYAGYLKEANSSNMTHINTVHQLITIDKIVEVEVLLFCISSLMHINFKTRELPEGRKFFTTQCARTQKLTRKKQIGLHQLD